MPPSRRDDLIAAAERVFAAEGFHGTGIERVLSEAGVAKMTLYNHFKSKDDLIAAVLETASARKLAEIEDSLTGRGGDRVLSYFAAMSGWFGCEEFSGCLFLNAAAEYKDADHPVRKAVRAHTDALEELFARLVNEAGGAEPSATAAQLMLLAEGAVEMAKVRGCSGAADTARAAAVTILRSAGVRDLSADDLHV